MHRRSRTACKDGPLVDQVTIAGGAGARASLAGLLIVFALAAVVAPALGYLFWLTQQQAWKEPRGNALEE